MSLGPPPFVQSHFPSESGTLCLKSSVICQRGSHFMLGKPWATALYGENGDPGRYISIYIDRKRKPMRWQQGEGEFKREEKSCECTGANCGD